MSQPIFYQTLNMVGIDPTLYYTNLATAGASITPEYPAPPFIPGTQAFGSDGSQFIFVQASTNINLTDFIVISAGNAVNPFIANSITTLNAGTGAAPAADMAVAATGIILKQSVTLIPANSMFWACTKGSFMPASTSANFATLSAAGAGVVLYTTTTAGILTTTAAQVASSVGSVAFAGFNVVSSISVSIPASVVPPVGTLSSTGFTVGPVVSLDNPRTVVVQSSAGVYGSAFIFW